MKNLYRHYRQVKVSYRDGDKPEVQGYEEIWNNGQKQVRRWTDCEDLISLPIETSDLFDFAQDAWIGIELPITESEDWVKVDSSNSSPRYIRPIEVEVVEKPVKRKFILVEKLAKVKQVFTKGWKKVKNMSQKLPSAWKAAWQELNRFD